MTPQYQRGDRVRKRGYKLKGSVELNSFDDRVRVKWDNGSEGYLHPELLKKLKPKKKVRREWTGAFATADSYSPKTIIFVPDQAIGAMENKPTLFKKMTLREVLPASKKPGKRITYEQLRSAVYNLFKQTNSHLIAESMANAVCESVNLTPSESAKEKKV